METTEYYIRRINETLEEFEDARTVSCISVIVDLISIMLRVAQAKESKRYVRRRRKRS